MNTVSFPSVSQSMPLASNSNTNSSNTSLGTQNSFASVLKDSLNQVNADQLNADNITNEMINGCNVDLSQVMIAQQKANITLSAAVQVRNKVIDAYQQMMSMQV